MSKTMLLKNRAVFFALKLTLSATASVAFTHTAYANAASSMLVMSGALEDNQANENTIIVQCDTANKQNCSQAIIQAKQEIENQKRIEAIETQDKFFKVLEDKVIGKEGENVKKFEESTKTFFYAMTFLTVMMGLVLAILNFGRENL